MDWGIEHFGIFPIFLEVYIGFRFFFGFLKSLLISKKIKKFGEIGNCTILFLSEISEYFSEIRNFSERGCERKQLETGVKETAEENNARVAKEAAQQWKRGGGGTIAGSKIGNFWIGIGGNWKFHSDYRP